MNGHKYPRQFENVTKDGSVRRLRIPGGWIVHSSTEIIIGNIYSSVSEAMIEISDKPGQPEWVLEGK